MEKEIHGILGVRVSWKWRRVVVAGQQVFVRAVVGKINRLVEETKEAEARIG